MTLELDEATPLGAFYGAAKRYPGGIDQLARDMDVKRPTLYAKLRGEKGAPNMFFLLLMRKSPQQPPRLPTRSHSVGIGRMVCPYLRLVA